MPFNVFFHRLFSFGKAKSACRSLRRSDKFVAAYKKWVTAQVYLNWTGLFFKAYHYQKCKISSPTVRVQLIEEPSLTGAVLFYDPSIGPENFSFLFELLKDRTQELGYNLHSSDTREMNNDGHSERIENYVLIPPAADVPDSTLCNQLYGTIHLNYVLINKNPGYIRLAANTYIDPYFSKPLPFMELLKRVLQPDEECR